MDASAPAGGTGGVQRGPLLVQILVLLFWVIFWMYQLDEVCIVVFTNMGLIVTIERILFRQCRRPSSSRRDLDKVLKEIFYLFFKKSCTIRFQNDWNFIEISHKISLSIPFNFVEVSPTFGHHFVDISPTFDHGRRHSVTLLLQSSKTHRYNSWHEEAFS